MESRLIERWPARDAALKHAELHHTWYRRCDQRSVINQSLQPSLPSVQVIGPTRKTEVTFEGTEANNGDDGDSIWTAPALWGGRGLGPTCRDESIGSVPVQHRIQAPSASGTNLACLTAITRFRQPGWSIYRVLTRRAVSRTRLDAGFVVRRTFGRTVL